MSVRTAQSDWEITKRVIAAREAAGLKQADLAEKLGLSKQAYNPYEKGTTPFTVEQLFLLSRILNRSVEYFLGLDVGLKPDEDEILQLYRAAKEKGQAGLILRTVKAMVGE